MLVNNITEFRIDKKRYKKDYMSPNSGTLIPNSEINHSKLYTKYNYQDIKRPLKTNSQNLSFKGLSFGPYSKIEKIYSKKEFFAFLDKYVDKMGYELWEDITVKNKGRSAKLISVDGDNITLQKKSIPHLAWDGIIYPFKVLPGDILNGIVELLGKVPGLKNWSARTLEKPLFKNIRQRSKIDAKISSLQGLITFRDGRIKAEKEAFAKKMGKKVEELTKDEISSIIAKVDTDEYMNSATIQRQLKQFDPKSGNYDTKHERALNRLVSGLPPAIFLATDAYNLSRMMDDDPKAADKERKIRFRQEVSRILTSGYLTLITMGAFQKFINKSKFGIVLTTGVTVLVTEMFSRLSNGKHITRLTPEQARQENQKLNAPEAKIKPQIHTAQNVPSTGSFNTNKPKEKEQQKPLLSFDTLMKGSAIILGLGYGIKGFKHLPAVKQAALRYFDNLKLKDEKLYEKLGIDKAFESFSQALKEADPQKYNRLTETERKLEYAVKLFEDKVIYRPFTSFYKNITSEKFFVKPEQLDEVVKVMKENGFEKTALKYEKIAKSANLKTLEDGTAVLDFGMKDKKVKPLVNFVIAPFKFIWNTITLPYWIIDEKLLNVFRKTIKISNKTTDLQAVANSFDKIYKQATKKNFNAEKFKDFVQVNLLKAWNEDSLSNVSNAELSNLAKTAASIATIWFLMTDNYNMVMLKSNGNDKNGADTKFKERFVQEGSRLFYQTLLIDLFNSTFRNQYNASLLGMSWVTLVDTTLGEMLTRSSVGTALKPHTRDELIDIETKQNNSTGFKKKYYNFMQRLTGKRSIKSYEVAPRNQQFISQNQSSIPTLTANKNVIFKQNNDTLEKMRNGQF
ncbi:hypothetical protein IJ541_07750 [bacterium]|nr:hypothetical protein [bacterium]